MGKTKEMGWNRQHKVKTTNSKTASSANAPSAAPAYPRRPSACSSIFSTTMSWISPSEAQYSRTLQGVFV